MSYPPSYDELKDEEIPHKPEKRKSAIPDVLAAPLRNAPRRTIYNWQIAIAVILLCFFGYLLSWLLVSFTRYGSDHRLNVILMVSDGFGPASETFAREYVQWLHTSGHSSAQPGSRWAFEAGFGGKNGLGKGGFGTLPLDRLLVGQSRTRSSNSLVTDSAAGATAFSCAMKSYNGAIAVEPVNKEPCATVLEAAKHKGFLTGLVTTSRLTHATPAAFYAHVVDRDMESEIATFLTAAHPLGAQIDLAFAGGRCFFLPSSHPDSCRKDDKDPFAATQHDTRTVDLKMISTHAELDALPSNEKALGTIGLFNKDHMNYEIDRMRLTGTTQEPSLKNMTGKALDILASSARSQSAPGFFAMIEGARIDMAAHSNDPIAHLYDILAYQETVREVKRFVDLQTSQGWPTIMVSTSDHETGGLSTARQLTEAYPEYLWYPDALVNGTTSTIALSERINTSARSASENQVQSWLAEIGISDPTEEEVRAVQEQGDAWHLDRTFSRIISRRAQIGWSTHGHSGVDVSVYAYGYHADKLSGSVENSDIGRFLANLLNVDLEATTSLLTRTSKAWHNKTAAPSSTVGIKHFHGSDSMSGGGGSSHLYLEPSQL